MFGAYYKIKFFVQTLYRVCVYTDNIWRGIVVWHLTPVANDKYEKTKTRPAPPGG